MIVDFSRANPYGVMAERFENWKDSLFHDTYVEAEMKLKEIVTWNLRLRQAAGTNRDRHLDCQKRDKWVDDHMVPDGLNKVLAFVGDRGTGKSTVMLSFVRFCVEGDVRIQLGDDSGRGSDYVSFYTLPVIDPSSLSPDETLVGAIVAHIYNELCERRDQADEQTIRVMVEKCRRVHEAIRVRYLSLRETLKENSDDLDHLGMLAQTRRLRNSLEELVDAYLGMIAGEDRKHESLLFIPIDDLDASIDQSYKMAEEIRNFLMLPNVILPVALKIEQLSDTMEQHFIKMFRDLYHESKLLDAQPTELAAKYIQKLIPNSRQIMLPSMNMQNIQECKLILSEAGSVGDTVPAVDYFLHAVWEKTRIRLVKNADGAHVLIPTNLRALHQAILLLKGMPVITTPEGYEYKNWGQNLRGLEVWLLNSLSANSVSPELADVAHAFVKHPNGGLNAFVIHSLYKLRAKGDTPGEPEQGHKFEPLHRAVQADAAQENISIGDVFHLLHTMERADSGVQVHYFTAAMRLLYSIRMKREIVNSRLPDLEEIDPDEEMPEARVERENCYSQLSLIWNGLVYYAGEKITRDGQERMFNRSAASAGISLAGQEQNLFGEPRQRRGQNQCPAMTFEAAAWISMFVVGFGRVRYNDLHSLGDAYIESILPPLDSDEDRSTPVYISLNWMAAIHNLLRPAWALERLLWQVQLLPEERRKWVRARERDRWTFLFKTLQFDSADVLDAVTAHMVRDTNLVRKKMGISAQGQTGIAVTRHCGFRAFRETLLSAMECVATQIVPQGEAMALREQAEKAGWYLLQYAGEEEDKLTAEENPLNWATTN